MRPPPPLPKQDGRHQDDVVLGVPRERQHCAGCCLPRSDFVEQGDAVENIKVLYILALVIPKGKRQLVVGEEVIEVIEVEIELLVELALTFFLAVLLFLFLILFFVLHLQLALLGTQLVHLGLFTPSASSFRRAISLSMSAGMV